MPLNLELIKQIEAGLRNIDKDKDGRVSIEEYDNYIESNPSYAIYIGQVLNLGKDDSIAEAIDSDKDGYIVVSELLEVMGVQ